MRNIRLNVKLNLAAKINLIVLGIIILLSTVVGIVVVKNVTSGIKEFAVEKAKGDLKLADRMLRYQFGGSWHVKGDKLYKGSTLMNENYELVDSIGQDTGDTVTIFLGDTRIATNVLVGGERAVGTKISPEVAEVVLKGGKNYYGEAKVAGNMYQTAYMPIKDDNGMPIGIFYVGAPQKVIDTTLYKFFKVFALVLAVVTMLSLFIVLLFTRKLAKRLGTISAALDRAGNGDLTMELVDRGGDELTSLAKSYNKMKENLGAMIEGVMEASEQVAASSQQLTAGAEQTSKATEQITLSIQHVADGSKSQTKNVEESGRALEEITLGINNVAENSSKIAELAAQNSERAKQGGAFVENTVKQINAIHSSVHESSDVIKLLESRSKQIDDITEVITGIANQTNLLALNAAIEAARAGEHGKGFAVVADEVRKLAEQSQSSSAEISNLIKEIQNDMARSNQSMERVKSDVQSGLEIVRNTEDSFKDILFTMNGMAEQIDEMAAAAQQMSAGAQQVTATVAGITSISKEASIHSQSVAASTEEQLASMEEVTAAASSLSEMAMSLQEHVSKFQCGNRNERD
ncbi:methyl-accepting chemotaxis protein [Peribacillus sp. SCS-155]|uniref:methyl-accepting chemotaxis protein n=1 Tax=Peribacillus sedimenti TaxID=3115297 RepID=UPI003906280B